MRQICFVAIAMWLATLLLAVGPLTSVWSQKRTAPADGADLKKLVAGNNELAFDLYRQLAKKAGPSRQQMEALWSKLKSPSAREGYQAIVQFLQYRPQAPVFLYKKLRPNFSIKGAAIERLIAELDSDRFVQRERAAQVLRKLGKQSESQLRQIKTKGVSLELRMRIEKLLKAVDAGIVRDSRSLEVLEQIGTPSAQKVLGKLDAAWHGTSFGQQVHSTLKRLQRKVTRFGSDDYPSKEEKPCNDCRLPRAAVWHYLSWRAPFSRRHSHRVAGGSALWSSPPTEIRC